MTVSFSFTGPVVRQFGDAQVRFVVARGLRNHERWDHAAEELSRLERRVAAGEWEPYAKDHPTLASWHDAYREFGTNPNRIRPSVDALSRRLARNGQLPRISPAVDSYNLISVSFGTPAGAFDLDQLDGPVEIRFAQEGDTFTPLGEPDKTEVPNPGEVVYAQGDRVLTRHWNHRDADQTKVTPDSRNVVFIIERISKQAVPTSQIADAQQALADLVAPHADEVVLAVIDEETPLTNLVADEPGLYLPRNARVAR